MVVSRIGWMRSCSVRQRSFSIGEALSYRMTGLIAFLILIGVLITVHEFGHYIVAKAFGVKVEAFSIGFGSPIVQFKWGETEYKVCWVPLGGYVRMMGQIEEEIEVRGDPKSGRRGTSNRRSNAFREDPNLRSRSRDELGFAVFHPDAICCAVQQL